MTYTSDVEEGPARAVAPYNPVSYTDIVPGRATLEFCSSLWRIFTCPSCMRRRTCSTFSNDGIGANSSLQFVWSVVSDLLWMISLSAFSLVWVINPWLTIPFCFLYLRAGLQCLHECPRVLELRLAVGCGWPCTHQFPSCCHVTTC